METLYCSNPGCSYEIEPEEIADMNNVWDCRKGGKCPACGDGKLVAKGKEVEDA